MMFGLKYPALQRGKGLEGFEVFGDHYLLSLDGTGVFSSQEIHGDQCGEQHHRDGQVTYYHQGLGAVFVHPDHCEVFPLVLEPILKQDCDAGGSSEMAHRKRDL